MTGTDLTQFKNLIVRPALRAIDLDSASAVNLLTGTALVESGAGAYVAQIGGGPALGPFQMEPFTFNDCMTNFLRFSVNFWLAAPILAVSVMKCADPNEMIWNWRLACMMARVKYFRSPLALPQFNDASGLSLYHKTVYNSALGASDAIANTPLFQLAIDA